VRTRKLIATTGPVAAATRGQHVRIVRGLISFLLLALPLSSCHKASPLQPVAGVYDFSLVDVNPNSATYGQTVSSSSFAGKPLVLFIGAAT